MFSNGNLYKIFVGGGISATLALLGFMGNGIVDNDRNNVKQHIDIRREMIEGDMDIHKNLDRVKDIVTDIRLEQTEQRVLLRGISEKL
jgi:hypothetical protein